jgi:hypothetical protein
MTVLIQAGHEHIQSNCEAGLRPGTGAHDEIIWTPDVAERVTHLLQAHGVSAFHADANANCDAQIRATNFEAAVAIHYQSDPPHESGYFCGVGAPAQDGAADRSWALCLAVREEYEAATHLQPRGNWDSENITYYYLFEALSPATPFALIECGTGAPGAPDHDYLWGHKDDVARGIANGVLKFLGKPTIPAAAPVVVPPAEGSPAEEAQETPAQEAQEEPPAPLPAPPPAPEPEPTPLPSPLPAPEPNPTPTPAPPAIHPDAWAQLAGEVQDLIIGLLEHLGLIKQ